MRIAAFLAISFGASLGACLRYLFALWFSPIFPTIPLGTLAANLLGGFLMGLTLGAFLQFQALSPDTRLFIATGFLGGLTTFSTFSAEAVTLLFRREYLWALAHIGLHLVGTLGMTVLGFFLARGVMRAWA
jgi:CrcB protein